MTKILSRLLEKMTPQERAEVETFAVFVLARRKLRKTHWEDCGVGGRGRSVT